MSLPPPETVFSSIVFDYLIIPSTDGDTVAFGIETNNPALQSGHPRFTKLFFRTRRPIEEYRDFLELMATRHPNITLPPLPFQVALADEKPVDLQRKRKELAAFFQELIAIVDVFNDPCLPLFIQSRMSMEQIRRTLNEQEAAAASSNNGIEQVAANNGGEEVAADNIQQVAADNDGEQAAPANNQQVLQNRDGDNSSDGDSARENTSGSETDEPMFRMEDIE